MATVYELWHLHNELQCNVPSHSLDYAFSLDYLCLVTSLLGYMYLVAWLPHCLVISMYLACLVNGSIVYGCPINLKPIMGGLPIVFQVQSDQSDADEGR